MTFFFAQRRKKNWYTNQLLICWYIFRFLCNRRLHIQIYFYQYRTSIVHVLTSEIRTFWRYSEVTFKGKIYWFFQFFKIFYRKQIIVILYKKLKIFWLFCTAKFVKRTIYWIQLQMAKLAYCYLFSIIINVLRQ